MFPVENIGVSYTVEKLLNCAFQQNYCNLRTSSVPAPGVLVSRTAFHTKPLCNPLGILILMFRYSAKQSSLKDILFDFTDHLMGETRRLTVCNNTCNQVPRCTLCIHDL